jgi:hypothetical protein
MSWSLVALDLGFKHGSDAPSPSLNASRGFEVSARTGGHAGAQSLRPFGSGGQIQGRGFAFRHAPAPKSAEEEAPRPGRPAVRASSPRPNRPEASPGFVVAGDERFRYDQNHNRYCPRNGMDRQSYSAVPSKISHLVQFRE